MGRHVLPSGSKDRRVAKNVGPKTGIRKLALALLAGLLVAAVIGIALMVGAGHDVNSMKRPPGRSRLISRAAEPDNSDDPRSSDRRSAPLVAPHVGTGPTPATTADPPSEPTEPAAPTGAFPGRLARRPRGRAPPADASASPAEPGSRPPAGPDVSHAAALPPLSAGTTPSTAEPFPSATEAKPAGAPRDAPPPSAPLATAAAHPAVVLPSGGTPAPPANGPIETAPTPSAPQPPGPEPIWAPTVSQPNG
jgi:hypothetical protein